ncbi:MAG TPA: glycosyltransferase family A protein [Bacteroidota bacterium]|nr:glycosyltransferase family A protein [Bacteroidota bacterium]
MSDIRISVVIPTHNRKQLLLQCLGSLERQSLEMDRFEVIVVDDGSTDGTTEELNRRSHAFAFNCLRIENSGPSQARNAGAAVVRGKYIAFTEDDVIVDEDWLKNGLMLLESKSLAMLEGRTVYAHNRKDVRRFERTQRPSFIPCNLFVRKGVFDRLGGYDPAFYDAKTRLYFREDADFGFRVLAAGLRTAIGMDVLVEHPPQFTSLSSCFRHVRRYVFDPLLYRKHPLLFRQLIEVKDVGRITVRRPYHALALTYVGLLAWLVFELVSARTAFLPAIIALAFGCSMLFRYRYQGRRAIMLHKLHETFGFMVLPVVYLVSLARGCIRYRSFRALL